MLEFMKLELRKQRLIPVVLAGIFIPSLAVMGPLISVSGGATWRAGVAMMAFAWLVGALPLLPLVFGAAAGAGLRAEPAASAEAVLPLSPARKAAAALAAALLGYLTNLAMVLVAFALFVRHLPPGAGVPPGIDGVEPGLIVLAGAMILLVSAFAFAYAFRHGLLGMLLALALGAATLGGILAGVAAREILRHDGLPAGGLGAALIPLLALTGPLLALPRLARFADRRERPGFAGWSLIATGLAGGAIAAALWFASGYMRVANGVRDLHADCEPRVAASCAAARRHSLSTDRKGGLFIAKTGGGERLIAESGRNPVELLQHPWFYPVRSAAWDADGGLWVLTLPEPNFEYNMLKGRGYEIWHGGAEGPLKRSGFFTAPAEIERLELEACGTTIFMKDAYRSSLYAPMPAAGKPPQFAAGLPDACKSSTSERETDRPGHR